MDSNVEERKEVTGNLSVGLRRVQFSDKSECDSLHYRLKYLKDILHGSLIRSKLYLISIINGPNTTIRVRTVSCAITSRSISFSFTAQLHEGKLMQRHKNCGENKPLFSSASQI